MIRNFMIMPSLLEFRTRTKKEVCGQWIKSITPNFELVLSRRFATGIEIQAAILAHMPTIKIASIMHCPNIYKVVYYHHIIFISVRWQDKNGKEAREETKKNRYGALGKGKDEK